MDTQPLLNGLPGSPWRFLGILTGLSNCPKNLSTPSHTHTTVILPLLPTPNPGLCCLTPPLTASSKTPPSAHFAPKPKLLPSSEASKLPQQPRQNAPLFIRLYQEPLALRDRLYGIKYFSGLAGTLGMLVPHPRTHLSS